MTRDVVERLDALIQKRRSYVARDNAPSGTGAGGQWIDVPVAIHEDDDVPVLTEVVDIAEVSTDAPATAGPTPIEPMLDAIAAELANSLQQRLTDELPPLLDTAFEHFSAEVRAGIRGITETAVRDFIERRRQLNLPLVAPHARQR
jgi:hypothetical protein